MEKKPTLICIKCDVSMDEMEANFKYLKRSFKYKVLRCPSCGQVYLTENLTKGKMSEVEKALEEK